MKNGKSKKAKAEFAALRRRRELLMLDHIEHALPSIRAAVMAMSDDELRSALEHAGNLVNDPFGCFAFRSRGLAEQTRAWAMLSATYSFNVDQVVAGKLPEPVGPVYECPNYGAAACIGHDGLLTFEELREHMGVCVPAAHAAGKAVSDPWGRFRYAEHPEWLWKRSARGIAVARRHEPGLRVYATFAVSAARVDRQTSLFGSAA